jgi:hypothetical protein
MPILFGYCFVTVLWPPKSISLMELMLVLCIAIGVGFGISSGIFFSWIATIGPSVRGLIGLELIALIIMAIVSFYFKQCTISFSESLCCANATAIKFKNMVTIIGAALFVTYIIIFVLRSLSYHLGVGDGIAIWNMRARFLFRAGEYWQDAFNVNLAHPDYPLLIPASIARGWKFINNESVLVPIIIHMLFVFSILGLLLSGLSIMRSTTQGLLAFIILLGTSGFGHYAPLQYADIPLTFYFLATIILFFLQDAVGTRHYGLIVLAGITTGLASWTKNEGLLFIVAIICARAV